MNDDLQLLFAFILDKWEAALHSANSALQVAQMLPDWKQKYQAALSDPLLIHHTKELLAPARKILDVFLLGTVDDEEFLQLIAELREKAPN
jgi:hypothetical protein